MNVTKLNEELKKYINEADWDSTEDKRIIYQHGKTTDGDNWTYYDEGNITVNILGVDLDYKLIDQVYDNEKDQKIFGGLRIIAINDFDKQVENLEKEIKKQILDQISEKSGQKFTYIGGNKLIGIPNSIR